MSGAARGWPGAAVRRGEGGAALVTVLLFMTLIFILITSMLTVTGNEVVISALQRDGIRAVEFAQAGLNEAITRMEQGRPYYMGGSAWPTSLDANTTVTVTRRFVGANAAYQEIAVTSTVGRATRRLNTLVLQMQIGFPPNITFAESVTESGAANIDGGDVYAETFIRYGQQWPNAASYTYAGWRISKGNPDGAPYCYVRPCAGTNTSKWYPATRRTVRADAADGEDLLDFKAHADANGCVATDPAFTGTFSGVLASNQTVTNDPVYGYDTDDPDGAGPVPSQLDPDLFPCGLPYKWVAETVTATDETPPVMYTRYFKKVLFEHWFLNYWRFDVDELHFVKRDGSACTDTYCLSGNIEPNLSTYPQFGAVPPFPQFDTVNTNYDCKKGGGGTISGLPISCDEPDVDSDLGCKASNMVCAGGVDRPVLLLLEAGNWIINANLKGHGTIVVNGDLTVNGDFEYWGTIIVNGTLTLGAGTAQIHGGLVAESTLQISGNITVEGGADASGNVPVGPSIVIGRAWWER